MILVHHGINHYAIPVSILQQLTATVICANVGARPVKLMAVYLSLHYLVDADLCECFGRRKPVFLACKMLSIESGILESVLQEESCTGLLKF